MPSADLLTTERYGALLVKGDIVIANTYATDRGDESAREFQSALRHIGFNIPLQSYIQRVDGAAKGDWAVSVPTKIEQYRYCHFAV